MEQFNRVRTGTAPLGTGPLRPLTGPLPAAPAAPSPDVPLNPPQAATGGLSVGELNLPTAPVALAAVQVPAVAPAFDQRAQQVLADALAAKAMPVGTAAARASDQVFLQRVAPTFSSAGNATLTELSEVGKLSAADRQMRTMRGVVANQIAGGTDTPTLELVSQQVLRPNSITQMADKSTCATAVYQQSLAEANPGAYTRAACALLSGQEATLPDGTALRVSPENRAWIDSQNFSPADRLNALFQTALSEAVVHPDRYDLATDSVSKEVDEAMPADGDAEAAEPAEATLTAGAAAEPAASETALPMGKFGMTGQGENLKKRLKRRKWVKEQGGLDFYKVMRFYKLQGHPAFDPRAHRGESPQQRVEALKQAFQQSGGRGLTLPVHSDVGAAQRYHMVQLDRVDASGNFTVRDPEGKRLTYTQKEMTDLVAWDIRSGSNVAGGRMRKAAAAFRWGML